MSAGLLAASGHMSPAVARFLGWAVIVVIIGGVLCVLLKILRITG